MRSERVAEFVLINNQYCAIALHFLVAFDIALQILCVCHFKVEALSEDRYLSRL